LNIISCAYFEELNISAFLWIYQNSGTINRILQKCRLQLNVEYWQTITLAI